VQRFLEGRWTRVEHVEDAYKQRYEDDLFFEYYRSDRKALSRERMERPDALEHRFDAWRVSGRKAG
jgi:hypothetical protein